MLKVIDGSSFGFYEEQDDINKTKYLHEKNGFGERSKILAE